MKYVKFWIIISAALAGAFFLFEMMSASSEASGPTQVTADCTVIKQSVLALKMDYQGRLWDRLTATEQSNLMTQYNMVINDPQCFPANVVAAVQAQRQAILGH